MAKYKYPYSDFHELNLDYILRLCRESLGIGLKVMDKQLWLVNDLDEPLSKVTISYATAAKYSDGGNDIDTFLISAGTDNDALVFTNGKGEATVINVPKAQKAVTDVNGKELVTYMARLQVTGDQFRVTLGNGDTYDLTCPYSVKASTDVNSKDLTTYAASIGVSGNNVVLYDSMGRTLNTITVHYAEVAENDLDSDPIKSNYAHSLTTGTRTLKLVAKDGTLLSEVTCPYAVISTTDEDGNAFLSDYAELLVVDGNRIGVEAHDGTRLSTITVPFATLSTDATNAIESVQVSGDQIIFTTYGGVQTAITCPYSIKALKDNLSNEITKTYVANVTNNTATGEITFYDAEGAVIVSMIPQLDKAIHDSYNNLIADYIKEILVDTNSNYVTVVHGTGNSESIIINYSTHAWKDTNNNVIKNFYISYLECVEDIQDGHYKIVASDGDTPRAELFRFEVWAYKSQVDQNERAITSYVGGVIVDEDDDTKLNVLDGEDNVQNVITGQVTSTASGVISGTDVTLTSGTLPSCTYNAGTETITFNPGVFPTVDTVTDGTFTGTPVTDDVNFTDSL